MSFRGISRTQLLVILQHLPVSLIPALDTLNLGSSTSPWNAVYAVGIYATSLNVVGVYASSLNAATLYLTSIVPQTYTTDIAIRAAQNPARSILMYSWDTAFRLVLQAINGRLDIPRAGDITLLSNRLLNAVNAVLRLPNTRPTAPEAGDCRYDPATDTFEIYDGSAWRPH